MKRNHGLLVLILVSIFILARMPAVAGQQDPKPADAATDNDKFQRMGKLAIPGQYIVVLDIDSAGKNGALFASAKASGDLTSIYGGVSTEILRLPNNRFFTYTALLRGANREAGALAGEGAQRDH